MHELDALFRPRSVAIVGASADPNKVGGRPLAFLRKAGYRGRILPVNPAATEVQGLPAVRSLDEIDGEIDQVIVAVPAAQVPDVIERCIGRGVKALQIFTAGVGVGAGGDAGAPIERARAAGVRVLGPNSLGLFSTREGFFGTFATALDGAWPEAGGVGVATQSGAFGSYFFGMAQQRRLGFSHFVATGNEADVDVADCIAYMAADPGTRLIVTAMEGCRDGRKLVGALQAARSAGKPVLAMKVGVSTSGARAAATHTGSLSGEDRVFDAVLRDNGAFRAHSLEQLVDAALVATIGPMPSGRDLLVVTTSGGIGVLCADAAEAAGLDLPPIGEGARHRIREVAALAEGANPVDTSAGILGDLGAYARIAECALADRPFAAALCYLAHIARNPAHWAQLREPLYALRRRYPQIPFVAVLLADDAVTADLEAHGFSVFADPSRAAMAIAACAPRTTRVADAASEAASEAGAFADRPIEGPVRTETDAKRALARHGIAFAPERAVRDADEAVRAATEIGYPVVLKVVSPDIPHKTEADGVRLGLHDETALRAALEAMRAGIALRRPDARIEGFLVARELRGGVEVLVGTQRDPVFGPVVTVGAGGVLAELLDDVQVRLAPVGVGSAREMLARTRIVGRLVEGYRGAAAADLDALAVLVARLSEIAWTNREHVGSIDLNPVLALAHGAFALDALITTDAGR
ncbi:MAG: acetate--CoA ligase family protein [Lautropia sp.]